MSTEMSAPAPESLEAKALAELEKEGHTVAPKEPEAKTDAPKDEPKAQDKKPEEPDAPKVEDKKPDRTPTMVPAWKLKVAEDQKESLAKAKSELEAKIEELSKQKDPVTKAQQDDLAAEIKEIAKDKDVDVEFLTNFADKILKRVGSKVPVNEDIANTVKKIQEDRELEKQLNEYSSEFERDVLPLVADHQLSGEALSKLKESLKDYAFSETYARVPLKEIFAIKQGEFNISQPKRSSEGKAVKGRSVDVVDIDNMSEEDFAKLPPEKIEEFVKKKSSGNYTRH